MLKRLRRLLSSTPRFEIQYADFGFGEHKERRAVVSCAWRISTRALENFVDTHNPFLDPWLNANDARLMMHEEQIMISLPGAAAKEILHAAITKIEDIRDCLNA